MKCLFVRHPFAGWIVDRVKDIEYRTRPTNVRGRIGIIQSRTGTVIGEAELTGCTYNEELDFYEWELAIPRRFKKPVPFTVKHGAVVWLNVDFNPDEQESAPRLTSEELKAAVSAYEKELDKFLHPAAAWIVVMKDGRRIRFEDEAEVDKFEAEHAAEIEEFIAEAKE